MSTTYATQPPAAPPQYEPPRRSFAGPIVLILLGMLFLLGNLHVIAWHNLGHYFGLYWPALLILWGIIKLIEYGMAQHGGRRAAGIGVGGVFLVIFLVVAGLTVRGVEHFGAALGNEVDIEDSDFLSGLIGGQQYTFTHDDQKEFPAGANLRITSDRGSVTVSAWDQNQIKVTVSKKLRAENQEDANKADAATTAQLTNVGNDYTLNANTRGDGSRAVVADLQIYVPANASVDIGTRRGDVTIRDRSGNVTVSNSHGDVTLEHIKGNATLSMRRGTVRGTNITGDVNIDGTLDEVTMADIGGSVRLNGGTMDSLRLSRVGKEVNYQSPRTTMTLAKLDGDLTLESGDLNAKQITGPVRLATRAKDIHFDDVTGEMQIENSNGVVEIHATKVGPITITNRRGEVRLNFPAKAAFEVDARTKRGEITSDFGINVQSNHGESHATGTVGSGGPKVRVENDGGDVQIRKIG